MARVPDMIVAIDQVSLDSLRALVERAEAVIARLTPIIRIGRVQITLVPRDVAEKQQIMLDELRATTGQRGEA